MNIAIGTTAPYGAPFAIEGGKHILIDGQTGVGKSTLAENMAIERIRQGHAVIYQDPHGTSAVNILTHIPASRVQDVIYFSPVLDKIIGLNIFDIGDAKGVEAERAIDRARDSFENMIQTVWPHGWGAQTADIIAYSFKAIAQGQHKPTLVHLYRFLVNKEYRKLIVSCVEDQDVRYYFENIYDGEWDKRMRTEKSAPPLNKLSRFILDHTMKLVMGWPESLDFKEAMDSKKIIIVNLEQGKIGRELAQFLGSIIVHKVAMASIGRNPKAGDVYAFFDEFGAFLSGTDVSLFLAETRKYGVFITLITQALAQMPEQLRAIALANVGTKISFRVSADDADIFEREFAMKVTAEAFQELNNFQFYVKTVTGGIPQKPALVTGHPAPTKRNDESPRGQVLKWSRSHWGTPRTAIESLFEKENHDSPSHS